MTDEEFKRLNPRIFGVKVNNTNRIEVYNAQGRFLSKRKFIFDTILPIEARVLRLKYGVDSGTPLTYKDISRILGFNIVTITRFEDKGLKALKSERRLNLLKNFTDETINYKDIKELTDIVEKESQHSINKLLFTAIVNGNVKIIKNLGLSEISFESQQEDEIKNKLRNYNLLTIKDIVNHLQINKNLSTLKIVTLQEEQLIFKTLDKLLEKKYIEIKPFQFSNLYLRIKHDLHKLQQKKRKYSEQEREVRIEQMIKNISNDNKDVLLQDLPLPSRLYNVLRRAGFTTLKEVLRNYIENNNNFKNDDFWKRSTSNNIKHQFEKLGVDFDCAKGYAR